MATARVNDTWHLRDRKTRSTRYGVGSRWQVIWTDVTGAELKKSFRTKDAATAWRDARLADNSTGETARADMLWEEYVPLWRAKQIHQRQASLGTIDSHIRGRLLEAFKGDQLRGITRSDVQAVVAGWALGLAPATVGLAYTYLSGIFAEAVLDGFVRSSPCVKIKLPAGVRERVRPLTTDQVQIIADTIHPAYRDAVVFAAATGVRPGEWRGLTVDRVDLSGGWVKIDRQYAGASATVPAFGPPKTAHSVRTLKVGPSTVELLARLCESPGPGGLVFHTARSGVTRAKASGVWRTVREQCPWAGDGWHQLRHYAASHWLSQGASVIAVAHRLGHKDATETLATYAHVMPDDDATLASMSDGLVSLTLPSTATGPLQAG